MLVFPAVLLPLSDTFAMSMAETLSLSFTMYLLFGVSALPWGVLGDQFGPRKLLFIYHIGAGICCFLAAYTTANPLIFSTALAGIGLFSGIYHPVGLGWIAKDIKRTSIAMAYNGMFGNLGLAIAPLAAGVINHFYNVSSVYLVLGMLNLSGAWLLFTTYNHTARKDRKVQQRTGAIKGHTPFVILLVAMMLGGIVYRGTSVTLPAYLELKSSLLFASFEQIFGSFGSNNVKATVITSLIYLLGMLGQYAGGKVGERMNLTRGYMIFHAITIPGAVCMALSSNIPLVIFAMVHSFFLLGMQPIENTLVSKLAPPKLLSSAYGLKFILTFGVGALGVKLIGIVQITYGLSAIFLALALVSLCLVTVILILSFTIRKMDFS